MYIVVGSSARDARGARGDCAKFTIRGESHEGPGITLPRNLPTRKSLRRDVRGRAKCPPLNSARRKAPHGSGQVRWRRGKVPTVALSVPGLNPVLSRCEAEPIKELVSPRDQSGRDQKDTSILSSASTNP
ncbi:hypothetical protein EVAR_62906_1 [Eumeta japonica]|uniref:Uncharacterized protein n=1 Tax=Eumeta variegata TaxID=151549 RepID=A0A4C1Y848_EUMVA|nr:hypothetical protein EVAR_62906_1 [Eumeta japonica]